MGIEIYSTLANSQHFNQLEPQALGDIAAKARIVSFAAGQLIFSKDQPAEAIYVVAEGEVAIEIVSANGRSVRVTTEMAGSVIGEFAVLDQGPRTADARALTKTTLIVLEGVVYRNIVLKTPSFASVIINDLIAKLRQTDIHIEDLSLRSLKSRVAQLLLDLASESRAGHPAVSITQAEIADRLSATREKINMHLQAIRKTGAINLSRGRIEFVDLEEIAKIARQG